ncbi:hypothetical protein ACF0H5_009908 [Mactra antiquata]
MPFLPMKYPEYRISMEAALPSSVHCWLRHELELRGIDSIVYTRYIISLLLQDGEDIEGTDPDFESFPRSRRKYKKPDKLDHLSVSDEERKKFAVVKCLSAISDEKSGIETLVDELCSRLKDSEIQASANTDIKERSCSSDGSEDSGPDTRDKAQKYYAAFPALHGQSASTNISPSDSVWKNNPFVKSLIASEEESSSANEDAEIRKINIPSHVHVPKHRKPRKNSSRNRKDFKDNKKKNNKNNDNGKGKKQKKTNNSMESDTPVWPPGFAKLDPIILQSFDENYDDCNPPQMENFYRPQNELCTRVESLLKGMLLPVPEKTYKELQDVDDMHAGNINLEVDKRQKLMIVEGMDEPESTDYDCPDADVNKEVEISLMKENCKTVQHSRDDSVSPELQEQESWYTQPIDVIFQSQDDEITTSKLRLYKRNSNPAFSPDPDSTSQCIAECDHQGVASSPVSVDRNRTLSFASDDDKDDIWEGSVLIPSWLTEVISADENDTENQEPITGSFVASSPLPTSDSGCIISKLADLSMSDDGFSMAYEENWKPASFSSDIGQDDQQQDENCTPTPDDVFKSADQALTLVDETLAVSLVDLDYLSELMSSDSDWQSWSPEEFIGQRRTCFSTLWQSQVLFDISLNVPDRFSGYEMLNDFSCWQPLGSSPYSQLWDVNMQKRTKVSSWDGHTLNGDDQVWFSENDFIFMQELPSYQLGLKNINSRKANTLIPMISIDIVPEPYSEGLSFLIDEEDANDEDVPYADQGISMNDMLSIWNLNASKTVDPKLSKSFELVPSEHSAFNDVPRKLIHTHSEPNLVQFRQEFMESDLNAPASPQEHLYFSPKTHFRPITPTYLPELYNNTKAKQNICQDLFGGLPSTKTPYQQYQVLDKESDEESFIPSFKVKNYSKSIQTGESFDAEEAVEESSESLGRDTPETLTLSIIEDVIEEKIDTLITVVEEHDTANTDSAYETDYGGYQGTDFENDLKHGSCCYQNEQMMEKSGFISSGDVDNGYIGDLMTYKVESFEATYPHTNDWPDAASCSAQSESCWKDPNPDDMADPWRPVDCQSLVRDETAYVENGQKNIGHSTWGEDLGLDHLYRESEMDMYKNIWSSAGQEYYSMDVCVPTGTGTGESYHGDSDEQYDNVDAVDYYKNLLAESYNEDFYQYHPMVDTCEVVDSNVKDIEEDTDDIFPFHAGFPEQDSYDLPQNTGLPTDPDSGDYLCVKLVYKDKMDENNTQQSYGRYDLMPMPDEAVTLTELEKEWLDTSVQSMWSVHKPSSAQRKPCSFYLEGNCRRSDCKFAHDISNITCRFWEEGGCFKGPLCPFLHGYPKVTSSVEVTPSPIELDKEKFDLNTEEFPELSLSVKNGNSVNINHKKNKIKTSATGRKDKGKKGSGRRHSNKENRCEVKIVNKCSSSV